MKYVSAFVTLLVSFGCGGGSDEDPIREALPACLAPGSYALEWTAVSDTCDFGNVPTELLTIRSDGTPAGSGDPPDGCEDGPVTDVQCVRDFERSCSFDVEGGLRADFEYDFAFDFNEGTGSLTLQGRIYDGSDLLGVCVSTQRGALSRL